MKKLLLLIALLPAMLWANDTSAKDAIALADKALKLIQSQGPEKAYAAFNDKANTEFHKGELYIFVYDLNGICVSHGTNPKLIGKNRMDVEDVDGKLYIKEIVVGARTKANGWVDYQFKNPESGKIEPKTTYFLRVPGKDLVICCGIYK